MSAPRRLFEGGPDVAQAVFDRAVTAFAGALAEYLDTADTPQGAAWRTARYAGATTPTPSPSVARRQTTPCAPAPARPEGGGSSRAARVAVAGATSPGMTQEAR